MTDTIAVQKALEAKLQQLMERATEIEETLSEPGDDDSSESATESEDDEVLEKLGAMAVTEIQQIKLALRRIDVGTYGVCTACEGTIAAKRLEALPYAAKCVGCA